MARYWMNGGPTQTVISTRQELDDPQADAIAQRWDDRRANGRTTRGARQGRRRKAVRRRPDDRVSVEARREIVADVGRYFGVPTRILNAPAGDSETYSNVELDALDLMRYTLAATSTRSRTPSASCCRVTR
jgi:hypothetical protein